MKSIASVGMAAARQIVWRLLAILALLAAVELGLAAGSFANGAGQAERVRFGTCLQQAGVWYVFGAALLALTAVLCIQGSDFAGGRLRYTLRRLPMGEARVSLLWSLVHVGAYVVLWAFQVLVVLVCWRLYCRANGVATPGFEFFVECYLDGFLHSLLPLASWSRWIRNGLWFLALGCSTVVFGYRQRRGTIWPLPAVAAVLGWLFFTQGITGSGTDLALSLVYVGLLAYCVYRVGWTYEEES